jgi:glycosyltransferase involved in cell wall biosynthesis
MEKYHGYESLAKDLIPSDNYSRIGFVADEDIESYYSASDLTIYPYKVALASSGPMAISI